jgi:hypothetical protein
MTKLSMCVVLTTFALTVQAQAPSFQWAKPFSGASSETGVVVACDAAGNVYSTGYFTGTVDFDPGPGVFTITSTGNQDIYVSKLDAAGNFIWARQMGGSSLDQANAIAVDKQGNVYTTGRFSAIADFDPGSATFTFSAAGNADVFISKLDALGNFVWAKRFAGDTYGDGAAIKVDTLGFVYSAGSFSGKVDFDPGPATFTLTSGFLDDAYVSKLDPAGSYVWIRRYTGNGLEVATSLALDNVHDVYVTGFFNGTVDFDPGAGTYTLGTSPAFVDIFVTKLSSVGNFLWAGQMGGANNEVATAITVDDQKNIYLTGFFEGIADFDPNQNITNLVSQGQSDIFVAKLNPTNALLWAGSMGGSASEVGTAISVDTAGFVYTAGIFNGTADFDPGAATYTLAPVGAEDIFISKLNGSGNFDWAVQIGGAGSDLCTGIAVDRPGNIYTTGSFISTADFDPALQTTHNLTAIFDTDAFVHKLSRCVAPVAPLNTTPQGNLTICDQMNTTLSASAAGDITWYMFPTGASAYTNGVSVYTTPTLSIGTHTFYVGAFTCTFSPLRTAIVVTVNPLISASANDSLICAGETATLTAAGAGNYSWSNGSSGSSVEVSPAVTTTYVVTGSTAPGCPNTATVVQNVSECVGLKDLYSSAEIQIYPNPFSSHDKLRIIGAVDKFAIYDLRGRLVYSGNAEHHSTQLYLSNLPAGAYFLRTGTHTTKLVKID